MMPALDGALLAGLAALSLLFLFWGMARAMTPVDRMAIEERLAAYGRTRRAAAGREESPGGSFLRRLFRLPSRKKAPVDAGRLTGIARQLARADLSITPGEFGLLRLAAALSGFILGAFLFRHPLLGLPLAVLGYLLPRWYLASRQARRLARFNDQLGDTLMLMANSLRSGYGLTQALDNVAGEMRPPLATEFRRVVREIGLGLTPQEALEHLGERVPSEDLDLVITAIEIQHEVGGNLAEILDTISGTIRERIRIQGEIGVLTAQQRVSGAIIALLPLALAGILQLINPDYMKTLYTTTCGLIMVVAAAFMVVTGYAVMRRIMAIEV